MLAFQRALALPPRFTDKHFLIWLTVMAHINPHEPLGLGDSDTYNPIVIFADEVTQRTGWIISGHTLQRPTEAFGVFLILEEMPLPEWAFCLLQRAHDLEGPLTAQHVLALAKLSQS